MVGELREQLLRRKCRQAGRMQKQCASNLMQVAPEQERQIVVHSRHRSVWHVELQRAWRVHSGGTCDVRSGGTCSKIRPDS